MVKITTAVVLFLTIYICATIANKYEKREEHAPAYVNVDSSALNLRQLVYVPVNAHSNNKKTLKEARTTVLKIRNTSVTDSLYVFKVDYFNHEGELLKNFVDSALLIKPMATTEIVVKSKDFDSVGDNFMVEWRANDLVHFPIIQAISSEAGNPVVIRENGVVLDSDRK